MVITAEKSCFKILTVICSFWTYKALGGLGEKEAFSYGGGFCTFSCFKSNASASNFH